MISIEQAQQIILQSIDALPTQEVPVLKSLGRVVAENIHAPWDIPSTDNSAMDGFAFSSPLPDQDHWRVTDFVPAGQFRTSLVAPGEAVRIMTGAPIPPGCETVVPFEEIDLTNQGVRPLKTPKKGANIRRRGEDIQANDLVITAGSVIRPQEIGMLVSLGCTMVKVFRTVRVAILATGDELLEEGSVPSAGKIINSNSYSLAAQVLEAGGEPIVLGIAKDTDLATKEKIREGLEGADILITTGGVSVGDRDYVKEALHELGGELFFWKVNLKPGKPVAYAMLNGKPVFALPGNPVATMVGFELFVRPTMLRMMGHRNLFRPVVKATLIEPAHNKGDRPHLVRVRVKLEQGGYSASVYKNQSSANLASLTQGNGLLRLQPTQSIDAGSEVQITLLDRGFEMGGAETLFKSSSYEADEVVFAQQCCGS